MRLRNPFRLRPDEHPGLPHRWVFQMGTEDYREDPDPANNFDGWAQALYGPGYPKRYVCVFCGRASVLRDWEDRAS